MSKPYAHLQTMQKMHAKFQKDWSQTYTVEAKMTTYVSSQCGNSNKRAQRALIRSPECHCL